MTFELEYQQHGWASESGQYQKARGSGGKAQSFIESAPPLRNCDLFYMTGFSELSTERQFGQSLGPIPWSKITEYAQRAGLSHEMQLFFGQIIRRMDMAYISHHEAALARAREK